LLYKLQLHYTRSDDHFLVPS